MDETVQVEAIEIVQACMRLQALKAAAEDAGLDRSVLVEIVLIEELMNRWLS